MHKQYGLYSPLTLTHMNLMHTQNECINVITLKEKEDTQSVSEIISIYWTFIKMWNNFSTFIFNLLIFLIKSQTVTTDSLAMP